MGIAPSSGDGGSGSPTGLIDVQVGEVYDNVRTVAENIDDINVIAENIDDVLNVDAHLAEMQGHRTAAVQAAIDADADRVAAAGSAVTAAAQVPLTIEQVAIAAAHAAAAAVSALTAGTHKNAAEAAKVAAEVAKAAAELAAQNAAGGAAFGSLGGLPAHNAPLMAEFAKYILLTQMGAANGVATLNSAGQLYSSQLPAISFIDTYERDSEAGMLGLIVQKGDVCVRSDINQSFIANGGDSSTLAGWTRLRTPTDVVLSVNGQTGAVTLSKADVGLGNVDNTSDANKPVSTAVATALNTKLDKAAPVITGSTLWLNTNKMVMQHDGTHGYARSEVGNLYLGAAGFNTFTLTTDGNAHVADKLFVGGADLTIGGGGGAEHRINFVATGGGYWYGSVTNVGFYKPGGGHFYVNHANGNVTSNGNIAGKDFFANRGNAEGAMFFGDQSGGGRYLFYNGTYYELVNAPLRIEGGFEAGYKSIPFSRQMDDAGDHSLLNIDNGKWVRLPVGASAKALYVQPTSLGAAYQVGPLSGIVVIRNEDNADWGVGLGTGVTLKVNGETGSRAPTLKPGCIATFIRWSANDWTVSGPGVV